MLSPHQLRIRQTLLFTSRAHTHAHTPHTCCCVHTSPVADLDMSKDLPASPLGLVQSKATLQSRTQQQPLPPQAKHKQYVQPQTETTVPPDTYGASRTAGSSSLSDARPIRRATYDLTVLTFFCFTGTARQAYCPDATERRSLVRFSGPHNASTSRSRVRCTMRP